MYDIQNMFDRSKQFHLVFINESLYEIQEGIGIGNRNYVIRKIQKHNEEPIEKFKQRVEKEFDEYIESERKIRENLRMKFFPKIIKSATV